jgi:hypothetical protein
MKQWTTHWHPGTQPLRNPNGVISGYGFSKPSMTNDQMTKDEGRRTKDEGRRTKRGREHAKMSYACRPQGAHSEAFETEGLEGLMIHRQSGRHADAELNCLLRVIC